MANDNYQCTLAIIKPNAVRKEDEIVELLEQKGFGILQKRCIRLTSEQASEFYTEHYGKMFFPALVTFMSSGPIIAYILAKNNAIEDWRSFMGPTNSMNARIAAPESLRAKYGIDEMRNGFHGSDGSLTAEREIRFFFPDFVSHPVPKGQTATDYLQRRINPTLLKGLTELCKKKPDDAILWLADWLIKNNPNKPKIEEPN